jgi:hypothetical protein
MMNAQGPLREAQQLRVRMQTNNRLHLEVMAALSKTFRDNGEQVSDGLLRNLVFAVPDELPGEGALSKTAIMMPLQAHAPIPPQPVIPPQPFGLARTTQKKKKSKSAAKKKKSSKKSSKKR